MTQIIFIPSPALDDAAAEAKASADEVARTQSESEPLEVLGVEEARRRYYEGGGGFPPNETLDVASSLVADGVELRVFTPPTSNGVYLMIHSGGWVSGGPDLQDQRMWELACGAELTVACVRYRLAPEHRFPAAVDDCEAAALWLIDNAASVFGTDRLIIGGESAGAHLAVLSLLRLRDRHGLADRFVGANLVYGVFDLSLTPSARLAGASGLVLPTSTLTFMIDSFLGDADLDRTDPTISPLYADLSGLVPARFVVGDLDPMIDDTLFMSARWRAAGNPTIAETFPAGVHAFDEFPTEIARISIERQGHWLREIGMQR